ncbi:hypothetical protein [Nocardia sp. NPDC050710]|uniref:hypothetical protein n=1 Tax=Nocardia sp. NPDC050710 TaxID=3157220 RepID=UPI0033E8F347
MASGLVGSPLRVSRPPVDGGQRIGLEIGSSDAVKSKIEALLPDTSPISGGTVEVGPTVRVKLLVDPSDAEVTPSDAVSASTGSNIQMLWTWFVHPKHPTSALLLTAHLEVPLSDGHVISNYISLRIPVHRTLGYTAGQIFSNWATWSAIAVSGIGITGWLLRRRHAKAKAVPAAPTRPH